MIENALHPEQQGTASGSREHFAAAIIGAGPYGLALAAKLREAGVDFAWFGRLMSFWRENVPIGTRLLSGPSICSLSNNGLDCTAYAAAKGISLPVAFTAEEFLDYSLWFHRKTCPDPDPRSVTLLTRESQAFRLQLSDGSSLTADLVVIAVGMKPFAFRPRQFAGLPSDLVVHASDVRDPAEFCGRKVAIIGSAQSAIDCAALLSEKGADVEVIGREPKLRWIGNYLGGTPPLATSPKKGSSWARAIRILLNTPGRYRWLPGFARDIALNRVLRPAADTTLASRLGRVRFTLGRTVIQALLQNWGVALQLDDGSARAVDRVLLATGYRVDMDAIPFLSDQLRQKTRKHRGYPKLNARMESSVPGLYFLGAAAVWSFGPAMRLVKGAPWAAETVSRAICSRTLRSRTSRKAPIPDLQGSVIP